MILLLGQGKVLFKEDARIYEYENNGYAFVISFLYYNSTHGFKK